MQKTVSAVAVISGLIAGSGQASNELIFDVLGDNPPALEAPAYESDTIQWVSPPPDSIAGSGSMTFTSIELDGSFSLGMTYTINDGATMPPVKVMMYSGSNCILSNGETEQLIYTALGSYTASTQTQGAGNPNAVTCTVTLTPYEQASNTAITINVADGVPGIALQSEYNTNVDNFLTDVAEGAREILPFDVNDPTHAGLFTVSGVYAIDDGGTASENAVTVGMTHTGDRAGTCTVSKSSVFSGKAHYNVVAEGENLGTPYEGKCTVSFTAVTQNQNTFSISLPDLGAGVEITGETYSNTGDKKLPSPVASNATGEVSFVSLDNDPDRGSFSMKGSYKIKDGSDYPVPVEMTLDTCSINNSTSTEGVKFSTGTAPNKKWYLSKVLTQAMGVPDAVNCAVSIEPTDAPPITKATITIRNQVQ